MRQHSTYLGYILNARNQLDRHFLYKIMPRKAFSNLCARTEKVPSSHVCKAFDIDHSSIRLWQRPRNNGMDLSRVYHEEWISLLTSRYQYPDWWSATKNFLYSGMIWHQRDATYSEQGCCPGKHERITAARIVFFSFVLFCFTFLRHAFMT